MKALDQRFRARVAVTIEHTMRLPVSSEKPLQAQDVRLIGPADTVEFYHEAFENWVKGFK